MLLKINQICTITESFYIVNLSHSNGYDVIPCPSRGQDEDIRDYAVSLKVGSIRESGVCPPASTVLMAVRFAFKG